MATVWGTKNSETLDQADGATKYADTILGLDGNDKLWGLEGDDWLKGGGGADELHGGWGTDWADYSDSLEGVTIDLWFGHGHGGTAEGDTFWSIENVWGSSSHDIIDADNAINHLYGGAGYDWLQGRGGGDYLDGGADRDIADYRLSPSAVFINLAAGTNFGGDAEGDTLVSIEGLRGSDFNDILIGDDQVSNLMGGPGDDTLKGAGGDDWLEDGPGNDTMIGGTGNDTYYVGEAGDIVTEWEDWGDGDYVIARIDYTLPDNVEYLWITNNATKATGNELDNNILGNDNGNTITGLMGRDWLRGYGGADYFVWLSVKETGVTQATADEIYDFNFAEGDRIDVSAIDANVYAAGNQAFTFIGAAAFTLNPATPANTDVIPGEINYVHANGNTYIQLNTGESADVEAMIRIDGIVTPQANWFVL